MKEYEFSFKMNKETDSNARINFLINYEKSTVYIDNVEITKIED